MAKTVRTENGIQVEVDRREYEESRVRGFADAWWVADDYEIDDGVIYARQDGQRVTWQPDAAARYMPLAVTTLPHELARVETEQDALAFVRRRGLLGYDAAFAGQERVDARARWAGGDPLAWMLLHASTVRMVLDLQVELFLDADVLVERLPAGRLHPVAAPMTHEDVRRAIRRGEPPSARHEPGAHQITYHVAERGRPGPVVAEVLHRGGNTRPALGATALRIVAATLNRNLTGISRAFIVERPLGGNTPALASIFSGHNLIDAVYWLLGDASSQRDRIRVCANTHCRRPFIASDPRQRFCPPELGGGGQSPCLNQDKVARWRREHKKTKKQSRRRAKKPQPSATQLQPRHGAGQGSKKKAP